MEGFEEGTLGGEAGEREGCMPSVGRRKVDGEGEDPIAVVISRFSGRIPVWVRWRGRESYRPSYLSPAFGAILLLNFQLLSTRTTFSSESSRSIVFVSLNAPGSFAAALYLISRSRPRSISQLPVRTMA